MAQADVLLGEVDGFKPAFTHDMTGGAFGGDAMPPVVVETLASPAAVAARQRVCEGLGLVAGGGAGAPLERHPLMDLESL